MPSELMDIGVAARRFGIPTRELVEAWYYRRIRFVVEEGLPRLSAEMVEEYKRERESKG